MNRALLRADYGGMRAELVECLRCGEPRRMTHGPRSVHPEECRRCGYVGWAPSFTLTEDTRRSLRELPPERRRRAHLRLV